MENHKLTAVDACAWRRTGLALLALSAGYAGYWIVYAAAPAFHQHWLRGEDHLVEWLTFAGFAAASGLGFALARRAPTTWVRLWGLGLALFFLLAAGEEISWGQRIFGFATPEEVRVVNEQQEFNLHNLSLGIHPLAIFSWCLKCFGIAGPALIALRRRGASDPLRAFFPPPGVAPLFLAAELLTYARGLLGHGIATRWGDATALVVKLDTVEFKEMVWGLSCALAVFALRDFQRRSGNGVVAPRGASLG